jgi:DNA-binding XRE family transcriptional regulator
MGIPYEQVLAMEPEELQLSVKRRAAELIDEELHLRELRRLRKLTQARLSKKLKIGQEGVSRIEKRTDLYLSTLRSYVEGVGGKLSLIVEFPDRPPVILTGLGESSGESATKTKAKKKARTPAKSKPGTRRAA